MGTGAINARHHRARGGIEPPQKGKGKEVRNRTCKTGKAMWRKEGNAKRAAARWTETAGKPYRAYWCLFCKRWHLTTKPLVEQPF